ncbi:hypothetical protein BH11MYX4_BH11MYX4_29360 [soil metagenome]
MSRGPSTLLVRALAALAGSGAGFVASPALAGDDLATAQLTYIANSDAAGRCPDEESFRNQIAARLGYQPFTTSGRHRVAVSLAAARGRVHGRAEVTRAGQTTPGVRELDDKIDNCEALASALATTVAIALDPVRGLAPAPEPVASPPLPPPPPHDDRDRGPEPVAPAPPEPRAPPRPIRFFAGAGGVFSLGVAPGTAIGAEAAVGARREAFSLEISARIETMTESERLATGDRVEATVLSGALAPCGQLGVFVGCIFGRAGAFQGRAPDVVNPSLGTTVFGAVGLRAGVRFVVWRWISLEALAEAGLPLVRTSLRIGADNAWTAPPAFFGGRLAVVVLFP